MIRYLTGEVVEKDLGEVVIDVNGVGYGVKISAIDQELLELGSTVKLYVHENIKEDTYDLYGSVKSDTLKLFNQLLSVKNVGPKVALAVLSIGNEQSVRQAIAGGDVKKLQSAKGVGKRAAEQIIVELRDKVGLMSTDEAEGIVSRGGIDTNDEAMQALLALGFTEYDAQNALNGTDSNLSTEERVKQALKGKF